MENVPEEFLMQEQLAVILSSQLLEAQQRACYKNDLYCESNEPSIYSYNLFRKNLKVSERSFEVFSLLGFKPVQHSGVSQKRNGTLMNK